MEEKTVENTVPVPTRTSPLWTDHVMGHFIDSELDNGSPKVGGLRRVAELLIGPILRMSPRIVSVPTSDNQYRAVVEYTVDIVDKETVRSYGGSADANPRNVDGIYAKYLIAMAETRAKARALKSALGIDVVSAEETSDMAALESEEDFDNELINETQITVLNGICKRLNINLKAFANIGKNSYNNIRQVPYQVSVKMTQQLSKYQQDISSIPDKIKNYDENWRQEFYEG